MRILSIDPGVKHTGWAVLSEVPPLVHGSTTRTEVLRSGTIYRKSGVSATASINLQVEFFKNVLLEDEKITKIIIEDYVLYRPSRGAGNALKLVGALVSMPTCLSLRITELETILVNARTWKTWVRKTFKMEPLTKAAEYATVKSEHEADAICLGLFGLNNLGE